MTPSHHGLGSVVLCTAGHHTVAVDMRHVAGTGRVGRDRDHVVDLAAGLGLGATEYERVLHLQTPAGRVSLGVEKVSQPFDTSERIPLSPLVGAETARHFEAMAQVNGEWYLVLDVRPFTGGSAHAAEETAPAAQKAPAAEGGESEAKGFERRGVLLLNQVESQGHRVLRADVRRLPGAGSGDPRR